MFQITEATSSQNSKDVLVSLLYYLILLLHILECNLCLSFFSNRCTFWNVYAILAFPATLAILAV